MGGRVRRLVKVVERLKRGWCVLLVFFSVLD